MNYNFFITGLIWITSIVQSSGQMFSDVTSDVGIEHIHISAVTMGGGAVFIDYDNDGWQDIFMTGGELPDKLYRNIEGDSFEDVSNTVLPFIKGANISSGVVALDFDNNGCRDLFITTISERFPNVLLRNNCDGTFTNVSDPFGIRDASWSMGANITDINGDGWQDIYVLNYLKESNVQFDDNGIAVGFDHTCYRDYLYLNDGTGMFTELGALNNIGSEGCGLAVSTLDFLEEDLKGVYVANDFGEWVMPNELFVWQDSTVSAVDYGLDIGLYGMGIGIGDIDDDQDFDLYVTNIGKNALLINENSFFTDQAALYGVENEFALDTFNAVSWGTFFADLDNDRDQDLFVANGFINVAAFIAAAPLDPTKMYENQSGVMTDVTDEWGLTNLAVNRGTIYGDYNNDGFLDILLTSISEDNLGSNENLTFKLFRNNGNSNHYVKLFFEGQTDKESYGTIATLHADGEPRKQILLSSATHASQHEKSMIFGVSNLNTIDSLTVDWSDGEQQTFHDLEIDQTYLLNQANQTAAVMGCTDETARNYNPQAEVNHGCLEKSNAVTRSLDDVDLDVFVNGGSELIFIGDITTFRQVELVLYNTLGQIVLKRHKQNLGNIDVGNLASGIYPLHIIVDGIPYSKKVVIINE